MNRRLIVKQSGAALIVGLIVLLVLTILGLSSMRSMTTELKIASNLQDHNAAFQAAEAGLAEAKNDTAIVWTEINPAVVQTSNYLALDNSASAVANITYTDCRKATMASSLKMGQSWVGLVHEVHSTGTVFNSSGDVISENKQVLGLQTLRPGC